MFPRIYLILGVLVFLLTSYAGLYFYAHNKGYQEKELEDVKALQTARDKESKALSDLAKLNVKREVIYRDRIQQVERFNDSLGCLDNPFDDALINVLHASYNSR